MRFRRDAPAILIAATAVIIVSLTVCSTQMFRGLTGAVEQEQFDLIKTILTASLRAGEDRAIARAEIFANLPQVRKLFAARDRAGLLAECAASFAIQKEKYGVDQMQFHVPPATSFLRMHSPEQFGDDLSPFRPMVVAVNKDDVARKGSVIARSGPAIFAVAPIRDLAGAHSGTVDVGINFAPILDGLKATYQMDMALFIEEEPLRKFGTGVPAEILSEHNRFGKYVKFHSTHWELVKQLATEGDLAGASEAQYTRTVNGVTYGVVLLPLLDPSGEPLGMIAAAKDFSASRAAVGRSLVWQSLLALFAIVLLAGVILIVIRGTLLRPLEVIGARLEELRNGETPAALDAPYPVEMEKIAEHYEELRMQAAAKKKGEGSS